MTNNKKMKKTANKAPNAWKIVMEIMVFFNFFNREIFRAPPMEKAIMAREISVINVSSVAIICLEKKINREGPNNTPLNR